MPDVYTTKQGDTWDLISFRAYGSEGYMHKLIECNPSYAHITVFPSGVQLQLPEITKPVREANNLPPWRR